ncbi:S-layer homology domain-containing protein [Candidatus Peregrinibacteria bacterium]|nr:MAG: S-layer homology domain-containing protein [Candidatus Peregrinibacteria bacterium]
MHSNFLISRSFSKRFIALLAGLSLALYSVPLAFAASTYSVSPSTGTVGSVISTLELEYTVDLGTGVGQQTWADADTLTLALPANIGTGWAGVTFTAEFDDDATDDGVGEAAISNENTDNRGEYGISGSTLTIDWDETTWTTETGDTIRVLITSVTPLYADSTTDFVFGGATAEGTDDDPTGTATIDISAGDPNASVVLASPTVGAAGNTTVSFNPLVSLDAADEIIITFPSYINVSALVTPVAATDTLTEAGGSPTISCASSAQLVTCTVSGGSFTSAAGTIVIPGITSFYTDTTDISNFQIEEEGGDTADIGIDTAVALTNVTAGDAAASVTLAGNSVVGASGNTTVAFTLTTALDADDTVQLTFPSYVDISLVVYGSQTFGGGGNFSCTPSSQIMTCAATGTITAGTGTIILTGITGANVGTTDITSFEVENEGLDAQDIVTDSVVALTNVTAADAAASVVLGENSVVGASGNTTVTLTLATALDAADTVDILFPTSVNVSGVAFGSKTFGGAGNFACTSPSTQLVTCTADGVVNVGTGNIVLTGITGANAGTTDITSLEVENEGTAADDIATDSVVALTDVTAADAAASVTLGDNSVEGDPGLTTVTLTLPTALDAADTVDITFPALMDVSGVSLSSETFAGAGSFSCTDASQVVICTATGDITAGTANIILAGLVAFTDGTDDVSSLEVENEGTAADDIATDTSVAMTNVTAASASSGGGSGGGGSHGGGGGGSSSSSSSSSSDDDDDADELEDENDGIGEVVENPFSDLSSSDDYYEEILDLYERGVIDGYPDGSVQEENGMNRAELMKIVVLAVGDEPDPAVYNNCFSDVTDDWYAPYVCFAKEEGWISGYPDGSFHPGEVANNAEILKMILNTNDIQVTEEESGEYWYTPYVDAADELELVQEEYFMPGAVATRGYAFNILSDLLSME